MLDETRCQTFPEISGIMLRNFWKFPDFSSQKISGNFQIFLAFCFILTSKKFPEISRIREPGNFWKFPEFLKQSISGNFQNFLVCFILTSKKIPEISGINFCNFSRKIPEISGNFQGYFAREKTLATRKRNRVRTLIGRKSSVPRCLVGNRSE